LPPLTPTIAVRPHLLAPTGRPDIASTRSLVAAPRPPAGGDDAPRGSVQGLAVPVEPVPPVPIVPVLAEPPRWAPPVRDRAPAAPVELVHATDAYVGPAREPAEPYRAPGWLRAAMNPMAVPDLGLPAALARMPIRPDVPRTVAEPQATPSRAPRSTGPVRRSPVRAAEPDAPPALEPAGPPGPPPAAPPGGPPALPSTAPNLMPTIVPTIVPPALSAAPPARRSVGQSRRLGLGAPMSRPASVPFHPPGTPEAEPPSPPRLPSAALPTPVPYDLVHEMRTVRGVDVSAVPVHRGPDVDSTAEQLGARAYTAAEEVHLPAAAGETTGPEARALVAHELVHVAQQRALGSRLPEESSPAGEALEAEAAAVESAVRAGQPLPSPLPPPVYASPYQPGPPAANPAPVRGRIQRVPAATLVHPSRPAQPSPQTGQAPAQTPSTPATPSTPTTPPTQPSTSSSSTSQPRRDEANPTTWSGFGTAMRDSALAVFDSWAIDPALLPGSRSGTGQGTGGGPGGAGGPGGTGQGGTGTGRPFDRAARRTELQRDTLARLNAASPPGTPPITELDDTQQRVIEQQLDEEETAAGGTSGGGQDRVRTWSQLGGELRYGLADLATSAFGIDLTADEVRDLRGGTSGGGGGGAGGAPARAGPQAAGATGTAAVAPAGTQGRPAIDSDDLDLDEIAGRLYDRLRSRLRQELLLDRERAGLLADFR
jgi:hypothetical protein